MAIRLPGHPVSSSGLGQAPISGVRGAEVPEVLVIDDEASVRNLLRRILEQAGYGVRVAADGTEGLRRYRERPPDVVVVDLYMPGKEGMETIMALRRELGAKRIIAISGSVAAGTALMLDVASKLGAACTLSKPVEATALLAAVAELLKA